MRNAFAVLALTGCLICQTALARPHVPAHHEWIPVDVAVDTVSILVASARSEPGMSRRSIPVYVGPTVPDAAITRLRARGVPATRLHTGGNANDQDARISVDVYEVRWTGHNRIELEIDYLRGPGGVDSVRELFGRIHAVRRHGRWVTSKPHTEDWQGE